MSKCTACGDKPENTAKDFTKAVIEINNPETLVLLRKVVIPASMGDDTDVVPAVGKYHNVILQYEANGHIYLYSSDGIPTAIEANIPQEVLDQIAELENDVDSLERADQGLQQEIDELKNSPDVVDIVATYADLQAYDTSTLGDKDVIRVLEDETHNNESAYYRWDKTNSQWVFIGAVEGYYTKDQTDDLLDAKQDLLTPGENITIEDESGALVISAVDTTYTAGYGLELEGTEFSVNPDIVQDTLTAGDNISIEDESGALVISATDTKYTAGSNVQISPQNVISATDTTYTHFTGATASTDGIQGLVPGPLAGDEDKFLKADGTWDTVGSSVNVVQATGTSTTDVMSQNAVTNMVYARNNPASGVLSDVRIGKSALVANNNPSGSVAIGDYAEARGRQSVALGGSNGTNGSADARSNYSIAIGHDSSSAGANAVALGAGAWTGDKSSVSPAYSVALGANSTTSVQGEVSFGGTKLGTNGYNNSQYRLLTNVYDPQNAHDAATKGYVDTAVAGAGAATFTTNEWNALWA